ncbi:hypothetical protein AK812_SmicGene10916 [Symbiodinium microadriaticum]|uniref:Uncharacterized protein n=1 Tax=Symbiodinium microadriaticum TaxID=2951 RepID=A0A1Q9EEL1_SYMMI|nr:hypothetical protein AK812_SmicGene10916 [Symbiodinium microadriaticum]
MVSFEGGGGGGGDGGGGWKEDPEWKIGMPWILKATFSSDSKVDRKFGFSSGGADGGFLEITVPAGCQEKDIQVQKEGFKREFSRGRYKDSIGV